MMTCVAVIVFLAASVAVLAALWRSEVRSARVRQSSQAELVAAASIHYSQMLSVVSSARERAEQALDGERTLWLDAIRTAVTEHEKAIGLIHERHAAEVTRLVTLSSFGTATPGEAIRIPAKEEPEDRIRTMSEAAIAKGTAAILDKYREIGAPITEEEARTQAISMLSMRTPTLNENA